MAIASARLRGRDLAGLARPASRGAQLLATSGFAIAQPLFDLLGRNAEFFAVRGSSPLDIVLFALAVVFIPPAVLLLVELAVGLVSEQAALVCHLVFLGGLGALFAIQVLERAGIDRSSLLVAGALVSGAALAAAVARLSIVRSFLTILAAAPLVFLGFFFTSGVSQILFPGDVEVSVASVRSTTPVVFVVLDELPTVSLLDEEGEIDEDRFPSFARLARSSTWFPNSSTLSSQTTKAIPALLSGKRPQRKLLPIFTSHPENLFTLLGGDYRLNVSESQTRLCPPELCAAEDESVTGRMGSLFSDARIVYLHLIAPPALESRLPAIDEAWADFGVRRDGEGGDLLPKRGLGTFHLGRENDALRFIESLRAGEPGEPTLDFLHVLLPHGPWLRFPDGSETATDRAAAPGRTGDIWWDEGLALQAYQRHLLQLGYTDRLLGELIERLQELDVWSRALVVVTADHGVSFREGDKRRAPTRTNLAELGFTPLFVKLPRQTSGRVKEKHVTTVDILPTIADALDAAIPWETDGVSGFAPGAGRPRVRVGPVRAPFAEAVLQREASLARQVELFGTGAFDDGFFGFGPYADLVGESLTGVEVSGTEEGEAKIDARLSRLIASLPEGSHFVPTPITGALGGGVAARGDALAVAVNGVVRAVCQAYQESPGSGVRFSALVPTTVFRPGENTVQVFLVDGTPASPTLRELPVKLTDGS